MKKTGGRKSRDTLPLKEEANIFAVAAVDLCQIYPITTRHILRQ